MFQIAKWYNNYQAPAVLMIDDLSDAYIDVYKETYKNDWGYLCEKDGSAFSYLKNNLLDYFPKIKITFFTPYLKHNVINENSEYKYKKFSIGDRKEFTSFLKKLKAMGHEIAHHGSNHGQYIDKNIPSTFNNWVHEWALFKDVESGVKTTLEGVQRFKNIADINITGGKYCGYIRINNSQEIIDRCNFLYWCDKPSYNIGDYNESVFGKNNIISFPTNFPGNAFIKLTYLSGDLRRDKKKKIFKYLQPLYNLYSYYKIYKLYKEGNIISIQEHYSPSTSAGTVQSANIITDITSLNKIFTFLSKFSIWYATCEDIARYIYVRNNSELRVENDNLIINFDNYKMLSNMAISIVSDQRYILRRGDKKYIPQPVRNKYVFNLDLPDGKNIFSIN